jgi:peptide/nickel transport system permease protein
MSNNDGGEVETIDADDTADRQLVFGAEAVPRSQWQLFRRRFFRHRVAMVGLFLLFVLFVCCFGATWIAPFDRNQQDLLLGPTPPSRDHLFGTDELGRDYLTEVLFAGQLSLKIGLAVAFLSVTVGVLIGAVAGYMGRALDQALMRLTDLFLVIPSIALLAVALRKFGTSGITIILVLAGLGWMGIARLVRGQVLALREREYIDAARAIGASTPRIIFRSILPNLIGPIMVNASLGIAAAIIAESTLSFLGFGVQPPDTSWGNMLSQAAGYVGTPKVYMLYFPGIMILLTVLAVNFVGDGLRDAFDPQAKH